MQPELAGPAHDGSGANEDHVPAIERKGNEIAATMRELAHELKHQKKIVGDLLMHVGRKARCKQCGKPILWIRHIDSSHFVAYDLDGTNHNARKTGGRKTDAADNDRRDRSAGQ
jgi:hypothetical protein